MLNTPTAVFHPTVGLVGFTPNDIVNPLSLIRVSPGKPAPWTMPECAPSPPDRLRSIEPIEQLTIFQLDLEHGQGIGDKPPSELPPTPGEKKPGPIRKAGRGALRGFAGVVGWLTSKVPAKGTKRTWINSLEDWANRQDSAASGVDQEKRNREINRLLDMLKRSPAEGLSYAIPMSGMSMSRGTGTGGNSLVRCGIGFSLSSLFGSDPGDPWDIANEQRQALIKTYRELAVKEAQNGNYRRAAYIYGTLLGDVEASARVLEEGRYFDEAAVILRDKLKQPLAAARCLERGGRYGEAISLFLEHNEWLAAAAIHERLDQIAEAHRWYRHAASQKVRSRDYIAAAKLLEDKLGDVPEAERVLLLGAMPPSRNRSCQEHFFELSGRHGRHDRAREVMGQLIDEADRSPVAGTLAQSLAKARSSYPDQQLCEQMNEAVMKLTGEHLPAERSVPVAAQFTESMRKLAPEDDLLARDLQRYLKRLDSEQPVKPSPKRVSQVKSKVIKLDKTLSMPAGAWHRLYMIDRYLCALGTIDEVPDQLVFAYMNSPSQDTTICDHITSRIWDSHEGFERTVLCGMAHDSVVKMPRLMIAARGTEPVPEGIHSISNDGPDVLTGTPSFFPRHTLAVSGHVPNTVWVLAGTLADQPELILNSYRSGNLIDSINVELTPDILGAFADMTEPPMICLHARREAVVLTLGPVQMHFADGVQGPVEFGEPTKQIAGAAPFSRSRYALIHEWGVSMIWNYAGHHNTQLAARDLTHHVAGFTNNAGLLVLAYPEGCRIHSTTKGELQKLEQLTWPGHRARQPVDVIPVGRGDDFAVLFEDGTILTYTVRSPVSARL